MGLLRWLFDEDVQHFEKKIDRVMNDAEETAGRVLVDAQRTAKQVVTDATQTAVHVVDDAERRLVRAYVVAFMLIVGAGLVHFLLVRTQVRELVAAEANAGEVPAHEIRRQRAHEPSKKGGKGDEREANEDVDER